MSGGVEIKESGGFLLEGITSRVVQPNLRMGNRSNKNSKNDTFVGRRVSIFAQRQVRKVSLCTFFFF